MIFYTRISDAPLSRALTTMRVWTTTRAPCKHCVQLCSLLTCACMWEKFGARCFTARISSLCVVTKLTVTLYLTLDGIHPPSSDWARWLSQGVDLAQRQMDCAICTNESHSPSFDMTVGTRAGSCTPSSSLISEADMASRSSGLDGMSAGLDSVGT